MRMYFVLLTLLMSSNAFATKARLESLSQGVNGSYYLLDTRNVFLNAAQIGLIKDNADFEWGRSDRPGLASTTVGDAEGGFVKSVGAGKVGVQLGRVTEFGQLIRSVNSHLPNVVTNTSGTNFGEGQNTIDLMYGGGSSALRWGGGVDLTRSQTATTNAHQDNYVQALELRGGVYTDQWEGFGTLILGAQSEIQQPSATAKLDEAFGLHVGGDYLLNKDIRLFAHGLYDNYEVSVSQGADYTAKRWGLGGGAAYVRPLETNNARLFAALELDYATDAANESHSLPTERYDYWSVPFTLGIEADANSWLRIRTSVRQNILFGYSRDTTGTPSTYNYYENSPNNTYVAGGLGTTLNAFNFDVALIRTIANSTSDDGRVDVSMTYVF